MHRLPYRIAFAVNAGDPISGKGHLIAAIAENHLGFTADQCADRRKAGRRGDSADLVRAARGRDGSLESQARLNGPNRTGVGVVVDLDIDWHEPFLSGGGFVRTRSGREPSCIIREA